jgi:uncharacterized protein YhaN
MAMTMNRPTTATAETLIPELQRAIASMRVRVNARHAHADSLDRAALGIRSVHQRVSSLLDEVVAHLGWTGERRLAQSALEAMDQQLRQVLPRDGAVPLEKQRACLNHALFRAEDALILLGERSVASL